MNRGMKDATRVRHHDEQLEAGNVYGRQMDALLEEDPPVIEWVRNKKGIYVAASVVDPHTPNREKSWA